jgi:hypothetical protein
MTVVRCIVALLAVASMNRGMIDELNGPGDGNRHCP